MVNTEIVVLPDDAAVAAMGAERLAAAITAAVAARGRAVVALSGGRTPLAMFRLLAEPPYGAALPWAQTHIFWADERLVPPDDPGSNYYHAHDLLLRHVPLPPENIHRPHGESASEAAVAGYADQLAQLAGSHSSPWPRFDSVLLGLGSDGHTASLFPGSPVVSAAPVLPAHATYEDRPAERLTLSSAVINDAREVLFLVTGAGKAEAVAKTLRGAPDPIQRPAQRIQPRDGGVVWLLDEAAAAGLRP
jgi:6-phosphogluconolactonase